MPFTTHTHTHTLYGNWNHHICGSLWYCKGLSNIFWPCTLTNVLHHPSSRLSHDENIIMKYRGDSAVPGYRLMSSLQQVKLFLKMEVIESMKPNSLLCRARFTNWVRSKRKLYDSIVVECGSFHSKSVYSAEQPMNFYTIWQILLLNYGILSENSIGIQKVNSEENRIHYIGGKVNIYFIDYVIPNSQSTLWHVWVTK